MIKQIQLRGISRSPSDRLTSDGGCAESLNVQLDHGEIVPMPKPEDITDDVIGSLWASEAIVYAVYIHTGTYYRNNLVWCVSAPYYQQGIKYTGYSLRCVLDGVPTTIKTWQIPGDNNTLKPEVTSVGNTLIVSFNGSMWYFLFKDGEYKTLGDQIPIPKIRFYMNPDSVREEPSVSDVTASMSNCNTALTTMGYGYDHADLDPTTWGREENNYVVRRDAQRTVISKIWDRVNTTSTAANRQSKCIFPVFLRYAVRLYDGSLYSCSAPILVGADLSDYLAIRLISHVRSMISGDASIQVPNDEGVLVSTPAFTVGAAVRFPSAYSIVADFTSSGIPSSDWEDIVTGIDLFVSTPILPMIRTDAIWLNNQQKIDQWEGSGDFYSFYMADGTLDRASIYDKPETLLSAHQTTYFAKRWTLEEAAGLTEQELTDINYSGEWLSTQEVLKETYNSVHKISGDRLDSYNNRLLLEKLKMELYPGYPFFCSTKLVSADSGISYSFIWHLRIDGEEKTVITKNASGGTVLSCQEAGDYYESVQGFISYPDARAYKVDIYRYENGNTYTRSYKANTFSQINVSYVFLGFSNTFTATTPYQGNLPEVDPTIDIDDTIYMSAPSNPFIFPAEGVIDFDNANILGTAMVTKALSQGQFGQFPLYVFTSTGIWALGLNSEGDFVSKHAVSRDVALEGTIAPIDQAIVFTTKKGVMMLSGSDIVSISPDMNGKHYVLDDESAAVLTSDSLSGLVLASQNPESFQTFMENAKPVYDYAGERLVFGSEDYGKYMYVYRLSTGTWHKMTLIEGNGSPLYNFSVVRALNSYPDAVMSLFTNTGSMVVNLSTLINEGSSSTGPMENGLIVTRPFDLDAPDVRKTIKDLRIRGQFNRGDVKYILLGSFDGINWKRLTSLRGGSFKLFRLVIVTGLAAHESISWIDVDFETRFTNKLR